MWDLYCGEFYPYYAYDQSTCVREDVLLIDYSGAQWGMELQVYGDIVDEIGVKIE